MHPLTVGNDRPNAGAQNSFDYSGFLGINHPNRTVEVTYHNLKEQFIKEKYPDLYDLANRPEQNSCIDTEKIIGGILVVLGFAGLTAQVAKSLSDTSKNKSNK